MSSETPNDGNNNDIIQPSNNHNKDTKGPTDGGVLAAKLKKRGNRYFFETKKSRLKKLFLFETKARFYLAGREKRKGVERYRILKMDRTTMELVITEDPVEYSKEEFQKLMRMIDNGNQSSGGLRRVCLGYGILGFIRFLAGYYVILITKRIKVGVIGGHDIYSVGEISQYYIPHKDYRIELPSSREQERSNRYKALFLGMDLTNFYFSYTYDLTHTLQYNYLTLNNPQRNENDDMCDERFVWNQFLLQPLIKSTGPSSPWILPTIHGYYHQSRFTVYEKTFDISLIARRSRHFAGTRYLKRGVNEQGYVANDVETEQIVHEVSTKNSAKDPKSIQTDGQRFTSYTQIRGSIPLYWGQEHSTLAPKPPICVQRADPFYTATIRHFQDLFSRFGSPVVVLNLIKGREKQPRETVLRKEYGKAVKQLNEWLPSKQKIIYIDYDFHDAKSKKRDVLEDMSRITEESLKKTGFFQSFSSRPKRQQTVETETTLGMPKANDEENTLGIKLQTGLIRTNCIDSLDRTNAAQFVIGKVVFGQQLYALGIVDDPDLDFDDAVVEILMEMYQSMGNRLAVQYGGSHLARTMSSYRKGSFVSHSRDLLESFKRYYSNSFTDAEKQDCINIFLGNFIPIQERVDLWDLDSDYYLHFKSDDYTLDRNYNYKIGSGIGDKRRILLCNTKWWEKPLRDFEDIASSFSRSAHKAINEKKATKEEEEEEDSFDKFYKTTKLTLFDKEFSHSFNKPMRPYSIEKKKKSASGTEDSEREEDDGFTAIYGIKRWFDYDDHKKEKEAKNSAEKTTSQSKKNVEKEEDLTLKFYGIQLATDPSQTALYNHWLSVESLTPKSTNQTHKSNALFYERLIESCPTAPNYKIGKEIQEDSIRLLQQTKKTKQIVDYEPYRKDLETMMRSFPVKQSDLSIYYKTVAPM